VWEWNHWCVYVEWVGYCDGSEFLLLLRSGALHVFNNVFIIPVALLSVKIVISCRANLLSVVAYV
jgi:hypothetical protein